MSVRQAPLWEGHGVEQARRLGRGTLEGRPAMSPMPAITGAAQATRDALAQSFAGKRVISEARAARFVGLSLVHLRRKRRDGGGPKFVRLGERRIGYKLEDVVAWLDERTVGGDAASGNADAGAR